MSFCQLGQVGMYSQKDIAQLLLWLRARTVRVPFWWRRRRE